MADIDILHAHLTAGRIQTLEVRFKNTEARTVNRETALSWARDGHSLIPIAGHGHHVSRGHALSALEVGGEVFLRTDTRAETSDCVDFPGH